MSGWNMGVLGASAAFRAIGGGLSVDANGYRHHIFYSSGQLSVFGEKEVFVIAQDGGSAGGAGFKSGSLLVGGSGGAGGLTQYFSGLANQNISVTVGGSGQSSSASGISLSLIQSYSSVGGTNPGLIYRTNVWPYQWSTEGTGNVTNPVQKPTHGSVRSFWNSISGIPAQGGGGGGQGVVRGLNNGPGSFNITKGGGDGAQSGGGRGAVYSFFYESPVAGLVNTGGGGGGGATEAAGNSNLNFANPGAPGSSGYVVVSYEL